MLIRTLPTTSFIPKYKVLNVDNNSWRKSETLRGYFFCLIMVRNLWFSDLSFSQYLPISSHFLKSKEKLKISKNFKNKFNRISRPSLLMYNVVT